MISKRKLLKFINSHPNCSYKDIAKKFFKEDIHIASIEILRNKEFITGDVYYDIDSESNAIKAIDNIQINSIGKQYLEEKISERNRFLIPVIISSIALFLSIISFVFTLIKYLAGSYG